MEKTILVIDDEPSIRNVLEIHLKNAGHTVVTAASGKEGLEVALTGSPDLVLCDLKLEDMHGLDIIKIIKAQKQNLPVVAISGFIDNALIEEAKAHGVVEYLGKPFLKQDLLSLLERVFGDSEGSPQ